MGKRLDSGKRQKANSGPLKNSFEAAIHEIMAAFKNTENFQHAQTKGNEREIQVRNLFIKHLPNCYDAIGGEIVDVKGSHSPQMDVIVYNTHRNKAFTSGNSRILPAEAPLVTVEVKSTLNKKEIRQSLASARKLKSLRPLGKPIGKPRMHGSPCDEKFRYFHCIFAYNTDIAQDNWLEREYSRFPSLAPENEFHLIDRIYVVDRGLIMLEKGSGLTETVGSGEALMHFFLHAMNFCLREDGRRPPSDYENYAKTKTRQWKHLKGRANKRMQTTK